MSDSRRRSLLVGGAAVAGLAGAWRFLAHHREARGVVRAGTGMDSTATAGASIKIAACGHWTLEGARPPRNDGPGFGPGAALLASDGPRIA